MNNEYKLLFKNIGIIIFSNFLCALAINIFFTQNGLLSGGIGGLGIMFQYLTDIPSGFIVFILNIPLFIFGFRKVNRNFAVYGVLSMIVFSLMLLITKNFSNYFKVNDILIGALVGGILNGTGMGFLFRNKMCQDGLDIIAAVIKRKFNISIGNTLMTVNSIIVIISSILFGFRFAIYTIIAIFVNAKVLDKVRIGLNTEKNVFVISEKWEEVSAEIRNNLKRTVTFIDGMGAYRRKEIKIIYIVISSYEVVKLKEVVQRVDPNAFITVTDATEVTGSDFKSKEI